MSVQTESTDNSVLNEDDGITEDQSDEAPSEPVQLQNPIILQSLVSSNSMGNPVQILQAPDGTAQIFNAEGIQSLDSIVILAAPPEGLEGEQTDDLTGKVWQLVPSTNGSGITHIIAVGQPDEDGELPVKKELVEINEEAEGQESLGAETLASMLLQSPATNRPLPPGAPSWALKLRDCEAIGDSYRGWVASEGELDLILTFHKQQTQSLWGTRQSPSAQRQSTRLMWKSQYVPFDGIPFINTGSRAVVMECQYGPRRKGNSVKKQGEAVSRSEFVQTCPARIYIKKVKKFPLFTVDLHTDRKSLRASMDRAFQDLKTQGFEGHGEERWYVQLPTIAAHEFHDSAKLLSKTTTETTNTTTTTLTTTVPSIITTASTTVNSLTLSKEADFLSSAKADNEHNIQNSRMHPKIAEKIREMVQNGETRVYAIRKQLRKFVEREMFESTDYVPERHNLCFFPTVHDIQNHIYQAEKDIQSGDLPQLSTGVNNSLDYTSDDGNSCDQMNSPMDLNHSDSQMLWPSVNTLPQPETVTVTITEPEPGDGHIVSRIETHMSDGTTQVSTTLTPEAVQILSKLHPSMFGTGILQLQGVPQLATLTLSSEEANTTGEEGITATDTPTQVQIVQTESSQSLGCNDTEVITVTMGEGQHSE